MEDERTLLEKLARGDRASFDALYMRYAAKTEEFLCRMLKNRAEAEDITHDLFLKIWQNRSTMAGVTAFGSYLFRMARNAVYDRFDSRAVRTNFARQTNLLPDGTHIWLNAGSVLRDYGDLTGRRRVVELDGATASTALRFTSEPASGEFSRWFIDDICVTK